MIQINYIVINLYIQILNFHYAWRNNYDLGFNNLICLKCGKKYDARDLAKAINDKVIIMKGVDNMGPIRVTIKGWKVCYTSGNESDYIIESKR